MKKLSTHLICFAMAFQWSLSAAQAEIIIGVVGPLSGSALSIGEQQEVGAYRAIDDLNGDGGVLGHEIVALSMDDACDPKQAEAVAHQMVIEGVQFIIGHSCSGASLAAMGVYEDAEVVMISPISTNPMVTDNGGANVFRVIGRDDQQGIIAGDYLADTYADSGIAILSDGGAYGLGLAEFTKRQLNKRGFTEVLFDRYLPDEVDYSSLVDKLVAEEIDIIYVGGYSQDVAVIIRQAKERLPQLRLISGDTLVDPTFIDIAGEASVGTYFTFGPDIRLMPEAAMIAAAIRIEEDFEPSGYTLYSYGAVQALAQAIVQANSLEYEAVIRALKSGSFDTVLGQIGFDEKGDITGTDTFIWYVYDPEGFAPAQ